MDTLGIKGLVNKNFWKSKRIFITGHTGFKGSWLSIWLKSMDSVVMGYSLEPNTDPSLFYQASVSDNMQSVFGDIRDFEKLKRIMSDFDPEIIIHMAAQPLVRLSYKEPLETYSTNVLGTVNVLEAARSCKSLKVIINVTTDKCYENKGISRGYREDEPMGGYDPYSSSKGCSELVTSAYRRSFFSSSETPWLASARAGNVIGGGDWAEDRLIPDILRAFQNSENVIVRNPSSTRPWQHVLEPLSGYLVLAQELYLNGKSFSGAWNFGPKESDCKSVKWVIEEMAKLFGNNASWTMDMIDNPHEAQFLKLDCSKAANNLNWSPRWSLKEALKLIVDWNTCYINGGDINQECLNQIKSYIRND